MSTIKEEQTAFLSQRAKNMVLVKLSIKKTAGNICYLKILQRKETILIDSKDPWVDLERFPVNLGPEAGVGPVTHQECLSMKRAALEKWLLERSFTFECMEITPPHILFKLVLAGEKALPAGVVIPSFFEASWRALLDIDEQTQYLAIGRPQSSRSARLYSSRYLG